jgi:two-component system OmpR family sensor kinase
MSLRARLLISLAVMLSIALLAAGLLLVGLTRASLVDRVDHELQTLGGPGGGLQRLGSLAAPDSDAGRRLAVLRLDRQGNVIRSYPSGFASDPDPLPVLPVYTAGIPAEAYGQIAERPAVDGSTSYRVLTQRARPNITLAIAAPLAGVDAAVAALVRTLLLTGTLALVGLLVVAWLVVRHDLLPLERIARSAERIAEGDLSQRAGVPHDGTEVGRLGTAFDAMLDRIETSFGEQQAALEAKARSEERLRRFVADASHELRTPLTAVRGYADLYRAGGLSDPEALETAMSRVGTESRRMGTLVDDLLLLARLDQGRPVRRERVDLGRIAADAVADARALEPGRQIVAMIDPGIDVAGDEDRLRQVVGNLLANVRVHTPADSPLEVVVRADGPDAELRVVDHGPGIDEAVGSTVFDRFYREDPGRSRDNGGTGLGLSIASALVQAHDGRIWHEATAGGGATFVVRLPLGSAAAAASPEPAAASSAPSSSASTAPAPAPSPVPSTVTANSQPEHGSPSAGPASV